MIFIRFVKTKNVRKRAVGRRTTDGDDDEKSKKQSQRLCMFFSPSRTAQHRFTSIIYIYIHIYMYIYV